jgi:hypothetical protein
MSTLLTCPELSCKYTGSFRTNYELRRHSSVKHPKSEEERQFECCAHGCQKGQSRPRFARADKLTAHIRAAHNKTSTFACPHIGCSRFTLNRLELFVHSQSHLEFQDVESNALLRAVANAVSPTFFQCPVWRCKRRVPLFRTIDHLLDHGDREIRSTSRDLDLMNYSYAPSVEGVHDILDLSWAAPFMRVFVSCPICSSKWPTHAEFESHFVEKHVQKDPQHFGIWIAHVEGTLTSHGYIPLSASLMLDEYLRKAIVWKTWRFTLMSSHAVNLQLRCPVCRTTEKIGEDTTAVHHLSLLDHNSSFVEHRWKALALFPGLASHPVFMDLHTSGQAIKPHVFRLQQACNINTNRTSSIGARDGDSKSASNSWPMHDAVTTSQIGAYGAIAEDPSDMFTGVGERNLDPMVGGCDDTAISVHESDRTSVPKVFQGFASPIAGDVAGAFLSIPCPPTVRQCYSYRKRYSCDHIDCGLRFERKSELSHHKKAHRRPYTCDQCGKAFAYPKDRRRHDKTHKRLTCASSALDVAEPQMGPPS